MDKHLANLREEFDDVGLVDRRHQRSGGGYEITFDDGKNRVFPNVKKLREFCHQERLGKIDWLEKGIYEWRQEYKRTLKLLIGVKKDCLFVMDNEKMDKTLAKHLLEDRLFAVTDDQLL